jgi:DNA-directed RNA polymerase specialized sigma24 family protein
MLANSEPLLRHIRRLVTPPPAEPDADTMLLTRFIDHQDEAAFAAMVTRYSPMVFGVCRRVLGDAQHAEDALQATFLVLARKAAAIRHPDALAGWLHGVARRVALKARGSAARRACTRLACPPEFRRTDTRTPWPSCPRVSC